MPNSWVDADKAADYLARADRLPHRREGEGVLVRDLAARFRAGCSISDAATGASTALVLAAYPASTAMCVDMSPTMLDAGAPAFDGDDRVTVVDHDFADPLPDPGRLRRARSTAVVSSLAIHHVTDERKRSLYAEIAARLTPGGVFANLDIVASPTQALHDRWRDEMGARDDPADVLCAMSDQLAWIPEAGLQNVDCIWKWRSLALMRGERS